MAALLDIVKKGSTDRSVTIRIIDSGDGTPETGVVYNTEGIDLWYRREGATVTAITEVTQTVSGAHSDGGVVHIGTGEYRLDLPDAAFATGAQYVDVGGTVTGMIVIGGRVRLVDVDLEDTVRAGLTALPNAAAAATGGLYIRGTGAGAINQDANGRIDVNIAAISTDATSADNLEAYTDGTTPIPANVTQFGGSAATAAGGRPEVNVSHFAGTSATSSGGIPAVNTVQWRGTQPNNLTSGRVDTTVGAMQADTLTATAIAADALTAAKLASDAGTEIANAVWAKVCESEGSYTAQQIMSVALAVLAGRTSNGGNTLSTPNNNATRVAATTDGSNNRTAITVTPSS